MSRSLCVLTYFCGFHGLLTSFCLQMTGCYKRGEKIQPQCLLRDSFACSYLKSKRQYIAVLKSKRQKDYGESTNTYLYLPTYLLTFFCKTKLRNFVKVKGGSIEKIMLVFRFTLLKTITERIVLSVVHQSR